jgi:hypothetical protein
MEPPDFLHLTAETLDGLAEGSGVISAKVEVSGIESTLIEQLTVMGVDPLATTASTSLKWSAGL